MRRYKGILSLQATVLRLYQKPSLFSLTKVNFLSYDKNPVSNNTSDNTMNDSSKKKDEIPSSSHQQSTIHQRNNEDHLNMPASMKKTAESIGTATLHATHELNKVYHDLEQQLMSRINESNTKRFRMIVLGTLLAIVWIVSVFGKPIRAQVAKGTADLAKETLEDESFKVQTQELARAIVQTILNDKEVTAQAALFLHTASSEPETQSALLALTLHVLQHPDSVVELGKLLGEVIKKLSVDKQTTDSLAILLANAMQDAAVYSSLVHVLGVMSADPAVGRAFSTLLAKICADEEVKKVQIQQNYHYHYTSIRINFNFFIHRSVGNTLAGEGVGRRYFGGSQRGGPFA